MDGLKKASCIVGRRSGGWLGEDLVGGRKKIYWMIGRRSCEWLQEVLMDD